MPQREDWDLQDRVRYFIGESGPQLPSQEYEDRIDSELEHMSAKELLMWISIVVADMGLIPRAAPPNVGGGQNAAAGSMVPGSGGTDKPSDT